MPSVCSMPMARVCILRFIRTAGLTLEVAFFALLRTSQGQAGLILLSTFSNYREPLK